MNIKPLLTKAEKTQVDIVGLYHKVNLPVDTKLGKHFAEAANDVWLQFLEKKRVDI